MPMLYLQCESGLGSWICIGLTIGSEMLWSRMHHLPADTFVLTDKTEVDTACITQTTSNLIQMCTQHYYPYITVTNKVRQSADITPNPPRKKNKIK